MPRTWKSLGRPPVLITEEEQKIVDEAYKRYRFSASLLEPIIQRDYRVSISHNRIQKILLMQNNAKRLDKEIIRWRFVVLMNKSTAFHWLYGLAPKTQ